MPKLYSREEYKKIMNGRSVFSKDECPFCDLEAQKEYTIWKWKYWSIIYNKYPYTGNDQHIMAVPQEHKEFFTDFTPEELGELHEVHQQVSKFYGDKTYFSFCRETHGDKTKSIHHYHQHFIGWAILQGKYLRKMLQNQGFPIEQE